MNQNKVQAIYSLTPMQEGMLYHSVMDQQSGTNLVQMQTCIQGVFHVSVFEESIQRLVQRHETLRSIFLYEGLQEPKQVIMSQRRCKVHYENITHMTTEESQEYVKAYLEQDRKRKMNLSKDMLLRVAIFQNKEQEYQIMLTFHHIILDGWSVGIIMDELYRIYDHMVTGDTIQLKEPVNLSEYMSWIKNNNENESLYYWKSLLKDYSEPAIIPKSWNGMNGEEYVRRDSESILPATLVEKIKQLNQRYHITLGSFVHTIWGILLQKYSNNDDVVFGTVVSGRNTKIKEVEQIVGMLINTIPFRVTVDNSTSFSELTQKVQQELVDSEKHSYLQLADIQTLSKLRNNLIHHVIAFENYHVTKTRNEDREYQIQKHTAYEQTNYDFSIVFMPGETLKIKVTYNSKVYSEVFVQQIHCHIENMIRCVLDNPDILVHDIELMDSEEKKLLIEKYNDTTCTYSKDKLLHELFEEQVELHPKKCAIRMCEIQITYDQLNRKANQWARALRQEMTMVNEPIGIFMERSQELILSVVAVLKANGMYVPFDVTHPVTRIVEEIKDLGIRKIMVTSQQLERLEEILQQTDSIQQIYLLDSIEKEQKNCIRDQLQVITTQEIRSYSDENLENQVDSSARAYVIYTSGSTGKPKGVVVQHRPVVNVIEFFTKQYHMTYEDTLLFLTSICFDLSVYDIWGMLAIGGTIEVVPDDKLLDHHYIMRRLCDGEITIWDSAPSVLQQLMPLFPEYEGKGTKSTLRKVLIGGDWIDLHLSDELKKVFPNVTVTALGGATEATIYSNYYEIRQVHPGWVSIPYGKPIQNAKYYILDSRLQPVPMGVKGDLYIGGECLAQGYINDDKLTSEKFIDNPFEQDGTKMYKTGDCARWMEDGNMEFLGRKDYQVKIRGYRIEIGEIEYHLKQHEKIRDVVVEARTSDAQEKYLVAYYIAEDKQRPADLNQYLRKYVPEYMVPSFFIQLEEFPLNMNGKLDRKALPEPKTMLVHQHFVLTPENERQQKILEVWSELLNLPKEDISIDDNFFDLGGHSLLAIKLEVELRKRKLINLQPDEVFHVEDYSTIRSIDKFTSTGSVGK